MKILKDKHIKKIKDGGVVSPKGFAAAGIHTKVKKKRKDLGLLVCEVPANAAAVYTLNQIIAAPLTVTKESLAKESKLQAIIVNSGNANACTGEQGLIDAKIMRQEVAKKLSVPEHYVAVASTGVIGQKMPMEKIVPGIHELQPNSTYEAAKDFNEAILTTDTCTKSTCYEAIIDGVKVTMAGAAKGSGMIAPNMATMLGFITTDANVSQEYLQHALKAVTDETFNRITVDGDTSTNDMVIVMASGLAGNSSLTPEHQDWHVFMNLLHQVCEDLAKFIAKDGEGATKLIEVIVEGALSHHDAGIIAKTVVGSSLVKSMVYGADPNWGRIIAAIGRSGVSINPDSIDIAIGPYQLLKNSKIVDYDEQRITNYLTKEEIKIYIHLHLGEGKGKAWGCDLTYEYVRINASYRT